MARASDRQEGVNAPAKVDGFLVEERPLAEIRPYPGNPRRNEAAVSKVAASIREFGPRQVIVVDDEGVIIAGHTRLLAARLLQLRTFPVHVARGLTPAQVTAYRLADNRVAQDAEWDDGLLMAELRALQDAGVPLAITGFEDAELEALFGSAFAGVQPHADPEELPPLPKVAVAQLGDLYQLGPHRLLCADARRTDNWTRLLGAEVVDMLWTDPPYDVAYEGGTKAKLTIQNDDLGHEGTVRLLRALLSNALIHLKEGGRSTSVLPTGRSSTPSPRSARS